MQLMRMSISKSTTCGKFCCAASGIYAQDLMISCLFRSGGNSSKQAIKQVHVLDWIASSSFLDHPNGREHQRRILPTAVMHHSSLCPVVVVVASNAWSNPHRFLGGMVASVLLVMVLK
jgi:hypothetical protein